MGDSYVTADSGFNWIVDDGINKNVTGLGALPGYHALDDVAVNDHIDAGGGTDWILVSGGDDVVHGGAGDDVIDQTVSVWQQLPPVFLEDWRTVPGFFFLPVQCAAHAVGRER
jgi:Ca2+-binding RTX toxin-like protein